MSVLNPEYTPAQGVFNQIAEACSMPDAFSLFVERVCEFVNRACPMSAKHISPFSFAGDDE